MGRVWHPAAAQHVFADRPQDPRTARQIRLPVQSLLRNPEPQAIFHRRQLFDRGPHYDADGVSGIISVEPPNLLADYPAPLVPQVDADGNSIDGVRTLMLQVPLGTYTGWNIRRDGFSAGDACDLTGSYFPLALTKALRASTGDTRPSLEERYGTLVKYTALATRAANKLVAQRLLLPSDAAAAIQSATQPGAASRVEIKGRGWRFDRACRRVSGNARILAYNGIY
jgi:hypothetical protein